MGMTLKKDIQWREKTKFSELSDGSTAVNTISLNGLVPDSYDYVDLGYTGDNLTSVVYKEGGSGGTTVATLTLTYDGDKLDTITKT